MGIIIDKNNLIFHLNTPKTSYIMRVFNHRYLAHVYWGKRIKTPNMENASLNRYIGFSPVAKNEYGYCVPDFLCQEYPTGCGSDYRNPAISVVYADGSRTAELEYESYKVYAGKYRLEGLPATYVESEEEAETLEIVLRDRLKNLKVTLMYCAYRDLDVITRAVKIQNESNDRVILEKVMSASVDYETDDYDFIELPGGWGKERHIERTPLRSGIQAIESRRGASSGQMNPFFALVGHNTNEEYGEAYGYNLVYSGNFTAGVEVEQLHKSRAWIGINDYDFSWILEAGDIFTAPEAVMVYSAEGLGAMSRTYHKLYRARLV